MAKTAKRTGSDSKTNKKNKNSGPGAVAMKPKVPKDNPCENIWSRRKFDILGKKRKGEELRIGFIRSRSIEKRKKTLLKEHERSGKSSLYVDKRIGEKNDELGSLIKLLCGPSASVREVSQHTSAHDTPNSVEEGVVEGEETRYKTKKEVMEQVILKRNILAYLHFVS